MLIKMDHIRKSLIAGLLLYPFTYLLTWKSLAKEGDIRQKKKNREILKQIHTPAVYLGRTQIILAQKKKSCYIKAT